MGLLPRNLRDRSARARRCWSRCSGRPRRHAREPSFSNCENSFLPIKVAHGPPPLARGGERAWGMNVEAFDILVIGAGIAGTSVAAELAVTHRVALLEREEQPGYHSTGRSAALFSKSYGNATVRALSRASADFFYTPPDDFAAQPLVRPRGTLHI